ncbi:MAG: 3-methyl-2-oxobutanoate dehydrogenase [Sandaracinaceae bacterium]|nr:3-methyl-2-oxobutanoate dehydrogenase [Sandaracinaceae bacterium]
MLSPSDDPLLGLSRVIRDDGSADPDTDPFLPDETLLAMYRELSKIRRIDVRMLGKQRQGKVGFFGTITGQEATPIATAFATRPSDWVFPALRESAIMIARGFPLSTWLAQAYGNSADLLKGRQMPSHMSGRSVQYVSWSSCIGPQIPQAVGAAYAAKLRGDDTVCVGFMGDGATSQPDFHHAMTFAARWKVPAVLVCQNNHWSISVPTEKQTASRTIAIKARAYGMPGRRVDGNDVLAVYAALDEAVRRAREGGGPSFVECLTYRIGPHSSSDDPTRYRKTEEVEAWAAKDPIARFERYLRKAELLDDARRDAILASLEEEIAAAIEAVEDLGPPPRESMFDDVYAALPPNLAAQRDELASLPAAPSGH